MMNIAAANLRLFAAGLASTGIVAASALLLGADGPVHQSTGVDLSFLVGIFTGFGLLTLLGTLAGPAQRRKLGPRLLRFASRIGGSRRLDKLRWPPLAFPVAKRLLTDLGWMVLVVGMIGSIPSAGGAVADRVDGLEFSSFGHYLEVFSPLSRWALIFLAPLVAARTASVIWPAVGQVVRLPWVRLLVLAVSYVALSERGVFLEAFEVDGSGMLPWMTLTLVFSYGAKVLAGAARVTSRGRLRNSALGFFFLLEALWVFALIGGLRALLTAASALPVEEYGSTAESLDLHLENLASLTGWAVVLLTPLAAARAAGEVWPVIGKIFGFPIRRLLLLGITYALFADKGVAGVLFGFNTSQVSLVLTMALVLSYLSSVMKSVVDVLEGKKYGAAARMAIEPVTAVVIAAIPSMVIWVALNHLPLVNAFLMDQSLTKAFGETHLPHFGAVYDLRYPLAVLVFAVGLSLTLPNVLKASEGISHKPLTAALGYSVVACLVWVCGSSLSTLGHGFVLFGAIMASGIFTLALGELARYAVSSRNEILAEAGVWLSQSKVRGFLLGASIAFYGLLLRPVVYEVLWFAALYEYMVILVLLLMLLLVSVNRTRLSVVAPAGMAPDWTTWSHHQQVLQTKADPRAQTTSSIYRLYLEEGELRPLWKYLFGLLHRSEAARESMASIGGTLRRGTIISPIWEFLPTTRNRSQQIRKTALAEALRSAKGAMEVPSKLTRPIQEEELREIGAPFIENGTNREALVVALVAAYWQKGADLDQVLELWFPVVALQDRRPKWSDFPATRSRIRLWNQRRRRSLLEGAVSHLNGSGGQGSLPVAISALETPIFRDSNVSSDSGTPVGLLEPGEGLEVISENETTCLVRNSRGVEGFASKEAIVREPILPTDKRGLSI